MQRFDYNRYNKSTLEQTVLTVCYAVEVVSIGINIKNKCVY